MALPRFELARKRQEQVPRPTRQGSKQRGKEGNRKTKGRRMGVGHMRLLQQDQEEPHRLGEVPGLRPQGQGASEDAVVPMRLSTPLLV